MLTRLEAHGFKNLLNFEMEFGPFTCIAGPNGVGKSNVFDAIHFLSLLADHSLLEAALSVRATNREGSSPADIFWKDGDEVIASLTIAAEMIVPREVEDDFGRPAEASSTYLRYEVKIGYDAPVQDGTLGRLILLEESLNYITEGQAGERLRFAHSKKHFRKLAVKNRRRTRSGFISTELGSDGQTEILVHADGGSRGRPERAPATRAPKTIIGTTNTSVLPTILAAKREMQSWRVLQLEPTAMRAADPFHAVSHVSTNGGHLAATFHRLEEHEREEEGGDVGSQTRVGARVAARLSEVIPVRAIRVDVDPVRQLLTLEVKESSGAWLPARSLSDGSLRFLTLAILHEDPEARGVWCLEEPENGIHPARMDSMVGLLEDVCIDVEDEPGPDNPLRQMIVATHSPGFVRLQAPDDLLFAERVKMRGPTGGAVYTLRCRPLRGTWRVTDDAPGVGKGTIINYLTSPPGSQIELHIEHASGPVIQ